MTPPEKIQEACDQLETQGPRGILDVYATMSDPEKARCDQWIVREYPDLANRYPTLDQRFERFHATICQRQ